MLVWGGYFSEKCLIILTCGMQRRSGTTHLHKHLCAAHVNCAAELHATGLTRKIMHGGCIRSRLDELGLTEIPIAVRNVFHTMDFLLTNSAFMREKASE